MSFGDVGEADTALAHVPQWVGFEPDEKARRLDVGELWIRSTYAVPLEPSAVQLAALVQAEQVAARTGIVTALFPTPGAAARGALTRVKKKVGPLEKEEVWAEPERGPSGQVTIAEVDAILGLVGIVRLGLVTLGYGGFVV